ncbi:MAG: isoprenylcysteine carboxylmethyltransferase family protein [Candidatus Omnitrophica bacterium]|nr:isoprenylcysteine carboxylmethyltransferase family protein [Candidatus Omnitrophota bacterium]
MKIRLKINGVIIISAFILVALFPRIFFRDDPAGLFTELTEVLGIALILIGQILRVSARGYKAENSQNSQALIQGGLYRITRNPMYLGILLIGLGVVLVLFNWWAITIFMLVFVTRYILLIFAEERKLRKIFSADYDDYCSRVPRLLPTLSSLVELDISAYLPIKLCWFRKEISSISPLLFLVLFIESWEVVAKEGLWAGFQEIRWLLITIILFIGLVFLLNKWTQTWNEANTTKS